MKISVYVQSIIKTGSAVVVTATKASEEGPPFIPFIRFMVPRQERERTHIGDCYDITIEKRK